MGTSVKSGAITKRGPASVRAHVGERGRLSWPTAGRGPTFAEQTSEGPVERELTDEAGNAYTATLETAS